jgi:hypothetical protein
MARDFKWLGSYRYGIAHLGGADTAELFAHCREASEILGWPAPCARPQADATVTAALAALALEST